ncbi:hypothetical protein BRC81_15090 [Halobacteriales archaeon QS_1_68_20]|nr:MAG: hypothetical protein BRC81_15090 [Halobacteriales archaeon QS_1_68_20]
MARTALGDLVPAALRDDTVRLLLLLLVALLSAFGSIASFVFVGDGASPSRLELGLLVFSVFLIWFVSLLSG